MSNNFDDIIIELKNFTNDITEETKKIIDEESKGYLADVKADAPQRSGEYVKGFKRKKAFESETDIRYKITNTKKGSLWFLLEKGHALVNGGRTKAYPHILANLEKRKKNIEDRLKKL